MVDNSNKYGTTSLIMGILSIVFFWVFILGLIFGILGIIFYKKQNQIESNGLNTGGLITSIIGTIFSALISLIFLLGLSLTFIRAITI